MPHYAVHHSCALTNTQYDAIASQLTNLHCTLFSAPSAFVNITFHATNTTTQYIAVGGKQAWTNYIHAHLRPRGDRAKLNQLVLETMRIWDEVVGSKSGAGADVATESGRLDNEHALHNVFVFEDIAAGAEQGFVLPVAGQEDAWVAENRGRFEKRAGEGDESMAKLLEEIEEKGWGKGV